MPDYLQPLLDLAAEWNNQSHALEDSKFLVSGSSRLVIVLLQPCNSADSVDFATMVYGDNSTGDNGSRFTGFPPSQEMEDMIGDSSSNRHELAMFPYSRYEHAAP